jgi:hypothetical protein
MIKEALVSLEKVESLLKDESDLKRVAKELRCSLNTLTKSIDEAINAISTFKEECDNSDFVKNLKHEQ